MGRKRSSSETNVRKEKERAIGLWTILKIKITSLKSYAKSYLKWKERAWVQRPQKEKSFSRYADSSRTQIKETTRRSWNRKKGIRKVYDLS